MKRAIFRRENIEKNIEHEMFATPIGPARLGFEPGELMFVATPKEQAPAGLGEYFLAFTVGDALPNRRNAGRQLFGAPTWTHAYAIAGVTEIEPFSLDDLVAAAGMRGDDVSNEYKGQTQHHRIIRTVREQDEPLFRERLIARRGTWSAADSIARNRREAERRASRSLDRDEIIRRLRKLDRENARQGNGKQYRPGRSQKRNIQFVELLKALYNDRCQVCGHRIEGPEGRARADVHHLRPRDGDRSDRLGNAIVVCPNAHARFELGAMRWTETALEVWEAGAWSSRDLAADLHLLNRL